MSIEPPAVGIVSVETEPAYVLGFPAYVAMTIACQPRDATLTSSPGMGGQAGGQGQAGGTAGEAAPSPARSGGKGRGHGAAKDKAARSHPQRPPDTAPPVMPPDGHSRYHCNRTYCNGQGVCFSPSPPNCIP
jgi:hypothetical protein